MSPGPAEGGTACGRSWEGRPHGADDRADANDGDDRADANDGDDRADAKDGDRPDRPRFSHVTGPAGYASRESRSPYE
jgi:hypothetical protein